MSDRTKLFLEEIAKNLHREDGDWEVWSGEFNRKLRNAISCGSKKEKKSFSYVFSYWQIQNQIKNLSILAVIKRKELLDQARDIALEAISEEE